MSSDHREALRRHLARQTAFAAAYSPLYAALFAILEEWLADPSPTERPVVDWWLAAGAERAPFDLPLLLLAGLHREVLRGAPAAADLAAFYPTVGGTRRPDDPALRGAMWRAIWESRPTLTAFIRSATVQTNETGRGLVWLLPLLALDWAGVHLVDLGASAGLNLAADQRAFRLQDMAGRPLRDVGYGTPVQFEARCAGEVAELQGLRPALPTIHSRLGCDIHPFSLASPADAITLASFIWGDQPQRQQRLREAVAAYRALQSSAAPIHLVQAQLPADLPHFLRHSLEPRLAQDAWPVVLYNTYIRVYLPDKGASLAQHIGDWAAQQTRPVLWLQWEPPYDDQRPPQPEWCAWLATLWHAGRSAHWLMGWAHPHGLALHLAPDWARIPTV